VLRTKTLKWGSVLVFLGGIVVVYKLFNPEVTGIFPRCPVNYLTGLQCPGCGSQRSLHFLLNLDILSAFRMNPLLILSIPYVLTGMVFDNIDRPGPKALKWRKILFGQRAIFIILFIIVAFTVGRNLL
jgi:hypothetical protein